MGKNGYWSGYHAYRHGTAKKAIKHVPILKGPERKSAVQMIIDQLVDWRQSPFELEGYCRHSLRGAFCLAGYGWHRADSEAKAIVSRALMAMGATRPSWNEGQYSHTDSLDYCSWCKGPMAGLNTTRMQRFCSVSCARNAIKLRSYETYAFADPAGKSAYRLIARANSPVRNCNYCGAAYRSDRPDSQFCSLTCVSRHAKGNSLLSDIACAWCKTTFTPDNRKRRYCSHSCHGKAMHHDMKERLKETTRQCQCCNATYAPTKEGSIYCSPRCASVMANRAYRARQEKPLHSCTCQWCKQTFTSKMPWAKFCSKDHKRQADALARVQAKRGNVVAFPQPHVLTVDVFDGWYGRAA